MLKKQTATGKYAVCQGGRGRGGQEGARRGQERGRRADPSDATRPDQEGFREEVAVAELAGVVDPACLLNSQEFSGGGPLARKTQGNPGMETASVASVGGGGSEQPPRRGAVLWLRSRRPAGGFQAHRVSPASRRSQASARALTSCRGRK